LRVGRTRSRPAQYRIPFQNADRYSLKIKGRSNTGKGVFVIFLFGWSGPHTSDATRSVSSQRVGVDRSISATHSDGAGYYSNVSDGAVIAQGGYFILFGGMLVSVFLRAGLPRLSKRQQPFGTGGYGARFIQRKILRTSEFSFTGGAVGFLVRAFTVHRQPDYSQNRSTQTEGSVDPVTGDWTYEKGQQFFVRGI
jgi:hypothetical protein